MTLTDEEKALLDGAGGKARQKAMELLVRYGDALGAETFVEVTNVAGVPGQPTPFLAAHYRDAPGGLDAIFSHFDLDSDDLVDVPPVATRACHLQGGHDPEHFALLGASPEAAATVAGGERYAAARGIEILKTCTPYLAGNVPARGEHCAWMESSAVIYCNSVLGAKTNTEGRESTSAAMLAGRVPYWGLHVDDRRRGTHRIDVDVAVESLLDFGLLGYFIGEAVQERIPVVCGLTTAPDAVRHKHFGAAAASSGGVEMYHLVGHTPEAPTLDAALPVRPDDVLVYGRAERRRAYELLNSNGRNPNVDFVMLGCPHADLEQIREACRLLDGRRISSHCRLWIFTSRAVRREADAAGLTAVILRAGGRVLTDTCSAISQAVPPGTRVCALDSAKQAHYLPAMLGIEAWLGTTAECIDAALTGRWRGALQ